MTKIITISLTDNDAEFLKELQIAGAKPSQIFRNALEEKRRQRNIGIDLSEEAIAAKFRRYQDHIQKLNAFLNKNKLIQKYENWEKDENNKAQVL